MFKHLFFLKGPRLHKPHEDGGDLGGGEVVTEVATPDTSAAPTPAPAADSPTSMLDAIERGLSSQTPAAATPAAQPRDEQGRYTFKNAAGQATDAEGNIAPDQAAALAAQAAKPAAAPAAPEDLTQMPEGLGPKAQERFQKLANSNREKDAKIAEYEAGVEPMRKIWTENQVQPEQFEMAMGAIGMINRGDFDGAEKVLREQLQLISLLRGSAPGAIDPLEGHPDLQQRVQQLLLSEADAIQLARGRLIEGQRKQQDLRATQDAQQRQQQEDDAARQQRESDAGLQAVDQFCQEMAKVDMDYKAIEDQLVPVMKDILQGVPPQRWRHVVETQYKLIKSAASRGRGAPSVGAQALRPTGAVTGAAKPGSMFDAMFPNG